MPQDSDDSAGNMSGEGDAPDEVDGMLERTRRDRGGRIRRPRAATDPARAVYFLDRRERLYAWAATGLFVVMVVVGLIQLRSQYAHLPSKTDLKQLGYPQTTTLAGWHTLTHNKMLTLAVSGGVVLVGLVAGLLYGRRSLVIVPLALAGLIFGNLILALPWLGLAGYLAFHVYQARKPALEAARQERSGAERTSSSSSSADAAAGARAPASRSAPMVRRSAPNGASAASSASSSGGTDAKRMSPLQRIRARREAAGAPVAPGAGQQRQAPPASKRYTPPKQVPRKR